MLAPCLTVKSLHASTVHTASRTPVFFYIEGPQVVS